MDLFHDRIILHGFLLLSTTSCAIIQNLQSWMAPNRHSWIVISLNQKIIASNAKLLTLDTSYTVLRIKTNVASSLSLYLGRLSLLLLHVGILIYLLLDKSVCITSNIKDINRIGWFSGRLVLTLALEFASFDNSHDSVPLITMVKIRKIHRSNKVNAENGHSSVSSNKSGT